MRKIKDISGLGNIKTDYVLFENMPIPIASKPCVLCRLEHW